MTSSSDMDAASGKISTDPPAPPEASPFQNSYGGFADLHRACRELFPNFFDGAKVVMNKPLSNHFQVSHTLNFTESYHGYRFGATYVGKKRFDAEAFPVMIAETDLDGSLNANIIHQFTNNLRAKFTAQVQPKHTMDYQVTCDYRTDNFTASANCVNVDLMNKSGILILGFMRRINAKIDLGVEFNYQRMKLIPGGHCSMLNYAARYKGNNWTFDCSASRGDLHLSYYLKQQPNLRFGVELDTNFMVQHSVATFGYQMEIPKTHSTVRASIDSNGTVTATLEKRLYPTPFSFVLNGIFNSFRNSSRFGIGLILGE